MCGLGADATVVGPRWRTKRRYHSTMFFPAVHIIKKVLTTGISNIELHRKRTPL